MSEGSVTLQKLEDVERLGWRLASAVEGSMVSFAGEVGGDVVVVELNVEFFADRAVSAADIASALEHNALTALRQKKTFH